MITWVNALGWDLSILGHLADALHFTQSWLSEETSYTFHLRWNRVQVSQLRSHEEIFIRACLWGAFFILGWQPRPIQMFH